MEACLEEGGYFWTVATGSDLKARSKALKPLTLPMQTLSEFHESHFVPLWIQGQQLDVKTEASYRQSISWWSRLTCDPPLDQITDHTVASFIANLCKQPTRPPRLLAR